MERNEGWLNRRSVAVVIAIIAAGSLAYFVILPATNSSSPKSTTLSEVVGNAPSNLTEAKKTVANLTSVNKPIGNLTKKESYGSNSKELALYVRARALSVYQKSTLGSFEELSEP